MELGVSRRSATAAGALSKRFALLLGPQFDVPVAQSSTFLLLIRYLYGCTTFFGPHNTYQNMLHHFKK